MNSIRGTTTREPFRPSKLAQIAHGDTFHNDRHPALNADYVLANPPFNDSDWRAIGVFGERY